MNIKIIFEMLNFSEKEKKISIEKFWPTLSILPTENLLREIVNELSKNGIHITKASDLKVLTLPLQEINYKIGMLTEIGEIALVQKKPGILSKNVLDINKRIKYCKLNHIPYMDDAGNYKKIILDEKEFRELVTNSQKSTSSVNETEPVETLENYHPTSNLEITPEEVISLSNLDYNDSKKEEVEIDPINLIDENSFTRNEESYEVSNDSSVIPMEGFDPDEYHNISNNTSSNQKELKSVTYDEISRQLNDLRNLREEISNESSTNFNKLTEENLDNSLDNFEDEISFMNFDGMGRVA